ncbi:hypothetical protein [Mucilaginibacter sp.]|uniref:hypothetical protein n=1 Tax=Mucilaginibacter sp. TaxID=1882438 RepID=UPI002634F4AF|nr:hypothetical protein [Mucilaginibacter sp.]MDB4919984.1 hypothetical protein [Mucilaginibacter sp.]
MDYTEILKIVENNLDPKYDYVIDEIKVQISSGSTGGEIGSLVGAYLKSLRDQHHPAYLLIKEEVDSYLSSFTFK